ncbi:hypothetical protein RclHR1_23120002 [Rhizophagus clarus]|uniref:Uncharacterized protein n=1 Tax=Rhizophagus clarus TaxID=94130 RepID=A0A2Z6R082_9GLOM|nr:hypothetical protein RclHR1_23120002 [Rhizophagus clarus]GES90715.1 hypothetical protein GLOIN_2v1824557 [Rhizophagus clarus]
MFLDTICNYRSTEPIWFRFFRGFFAIILTGIIIYYAFIQYQKVGTEASTLIKFEQVTEHILNMSVCTGIPNGIEFISDAADAVTDVTKFRKNVSLYNNDFWLNITINTTNNNNMNENISHNFNGSYCNPYTIPNNLLFLSLESFQFSFDNKPDLIFNYDTYDLYNAITNNNITFGDNEIRTIETAHFSLYLASAYLITYKPIIVYYGVVHILELNPRLEQLPIQLGSNEIYLNIRLNLNSDMLNAGTSRTETTRQYDYTDFISNLGGFYGAIAGIFFLFFGMQRHKPWGLAQKYLFSCTRCRKSLKIYFARKYVSSAGIPLVEKINKRPEGSSLEERVQILETLLRDYYLDDYYLKKVKDVRTKHKKLVKKYNEMNRQGIENTELNTLIV